MVSIKMVKVKRILETNPTITGDRTSKSKLSVIVLTIVFLVNGDTRNRLSLLPSISAARAFRFEGPILPFADCHLVAASVIYTVRKLMSFGKELCLHLL
jgi:hypothetical protein